MLEIFFFFLFYIDKLKINCDILMDCIFMFKICYIVIIFLIRILINEIKCLKIKSIK